MMSRFEVVEWQSIEFNQLAEDGVLVSRTAKDMAAAAAAAADAPAADAVVVSASDRFLRDSVAVLAGLRFTDAPHQQFIVGSAHLFWYTTQSACGKVPSPHSPTGSGQRK